MFNFAKARAKGEAKQSFVDNQARHGIEVEFSSQESERILREVKELGGWKAWAAQMKEHERRILGDPPSCDDPSREKSLAVYKPEPPEGEKFNPQESERILRDVKETGGWEAWVVQMKERDREAGRL